MEYVQPAICALTWHASVYVWPLAGNSGPAGCECEREHALPVRPADPADGLAVHQQLSVPRHQPGRVPYALRSVGVS
eukprot:scaffold565912_cov46-Prasinocladus_malaysianus.AAC.1